MKIWTCGGSPRSGSRNAWTRIKNVNGASFLSNFWNFFWRDPNNFLSRLVTMDETWLHHYDPETNQQSMEWRHSDSPRPKTNPSVRIRWKSSRLDFGIKTASSSLSIFQRAKLSMRTFWGKNAGRRKVTKGVLFLHDNAPAHRVLATQNKLDYLCLHCLDHPPYSPDLAPSDYHLFPGLKKQLKVCHFSSYAEVTAAAESWLGGVFWVACKS